MWLWPNRCILFMCAVNSRLRPGLSCAQPFRGPHACAHTCMQASYDRQPQCARPPRVCIHRRGPALLHAHKLQPQVRTLRRRECCASHAVLFCSCQGGEHLGLREPLSHACACCLSAPAISMGSTSAAAPPMAVNCQCLEQGKRVPTCAAPLRFLTTTKSLCS